jgi:hypothetical protein
VRTSRHWLVAVGSLAELCIGNAATDEPMLRQLVYRAYAIEFAFKFLMVAEIFKAISRLAPFPLRIGPFYTGPEGDILSGKRSGRVTK